MDSVHSSPSRPETFLILGAGQAGAQAASALRERGFAGRVVLVGEEEHLPYMRPPLSKKFLAGMHAEERLFLRPAAYYESSRIEVRTGLRATFIDRQRRVVGFSDHSTVNFDRLLLATGTRPRRLPITGSDDPRVHYLRSLDDANRLRTYLREGAHLAVVGAGYVGLEVAATAVMAGLKVTVIESADRVLGRVTSRTISDFFADKHRERGVDLRCGSAVASISAAERQLVVELSDGQSFAADALVVGIGAVPNDDLARQAGILCNDGILVDEFGRTSDPNVFAAGDCTRHTNFLFSRQIRLESVQNAVDQATSAAASMAGAGMPYRRVPWFWSQQFEFKLQSAGLFHDYDEVVESGDRRDGCFAVRYIKKGQLLAVDAINMPAEYAAARKAIAARGELSFAEAPPVPQKACASANQPRFHVLASADTSEAECIAAK